MQPVERGVAVHAEALVLTGKAITIVADRKADAVEDLLAKDKQSPDR
jgi:hypothetical protein